MTMLPLHGVSGADRVIAACIDHIIAAILMLFVGGTLGEFMGTTRSSIVNAMLGFSIFLVYLAFFLIFEAMFSATVGKMMFSLRVQRLDGSRCGWKAAIIRTALRVIEVNPLLLGCIPAAISIFRTERRQRLGDKLAGTVVTRKKF